MAPQEKLANDKALPSEQATIVVNADKERGPTYVVCRSKDSFRHPYADEKKSPERINQELNLNLGLPIDLANNKVLLWVVRLLNSFLIEWWEDYLFAAWKVLPLAARRSLSRFAWRIYYPVHKLLMGKRRGLHPDASGEYHALTTVVWWGRLFPMSIKRMRFALSQLAVNYDDPIAQHVQLVDEPVPPIQSRAPSVQGNHCRVSGYYVHLYAQPTEYTLFWLYGGAFLSGDATGNLGPAAQVAHQTQMDTFVASFRLVPEGNMDDLMWDVCLSYWWLCQRVQDPSKILILGISSGAGLCLKLLQAIAQYSRGQALLPSYLDCFFQVGRVPPMPSGAALVGPFVDYTEPSGCFMPYSRHDLIVNQRVLECGLPYLESQLGSKREIHSPVYQSFAGLPSLCIVTSRHEVVYDQAILTANRAREAGVAVTLGVWDYMCHVWTFLPMVPEGRQSMDFCVEWLCTMQKRRAQ